MSSRFLLAALLTTAVSPAFAQMPPPPTRDPAKVEAGSFAVEPAHTRVLFSVSHLGFTTYYGDFTTVSGTLDFNPKAPVASALSVSIPINTVSTTSPKLDGELKSNDWLDATAFPTATFKSTKIVVTGRDEGQVTGELTLHGVTKTETFTVKFNGGGLNPLSKKYTVGFEVSGKIHRSDFGVKKYVPLVGDEVGLIISAAFEKQG